MGFVIPAKTTFAMKKIILAGLFIAVKATLVNLLNTFFLK